MDDPRHEDVNEIIDELVSGTNKTNYERIIDRTEAIKKALDMATNDDIILIAGKGDDITVALASLVNGVGQNFKYGVLAAVQPVGAEDDAGALADAIRALEHGDAVVAVGCLGFRHSLYLKSQDMVFPESGH
jgi:hypothetical protein